MKTNFTLFALFLSVLSLAQYFQPSSNLAHLSANFRTNGRVVLGDGLSSDFRFQIYKNTTDNLFAGEIGNSLGQLQIGVSGCNGCFAAASKPGDLIFRKMGSSHNMIFAMANNNMIDPNSDTSTPTSPGVTSIRFMDAANPYSMVIFNTGKVTMGTAMYDNTDYRLYVKNGIKTEKVKVEVASANGWADYVFEADYNLLSLEEVENYIKENGHLPNIPSAEKVVEDGGFELKEMNVKLLEKIEELTLYIIDQNKRIEALEAKIIED